MISINPYYGMDVMRHQRDFHAYCDAYRKKRAADPGYQEVITIKAARQIFGKSRCVLAEILRFAVERNKGIIYLAPTAPQTDELFSRISTTCRPIIRSSNDTKKTIRFITGSELKCLYASKDEALRGYTARDLLVIDEGAFIADDIYSELVWPWTLVHHPLVVLLSTPYFKEGFFWDNYSRGKAGAKGYTTFDWVEDYPEVFDIPRNRDSLARAREIVPSFKFNTEYLGQWKTIGEESIFKLEGNIATPSDKEPTAVYWGLDFGMGTGKDYTAFVGLDENAQQIDLMLDNTSSPTEIIAKIVSVVEAYPQTKVIRVESTGSLVYIDLLRKALSHLNILIEPFVANNKSKCEMIENLAAGFEHHRLKIMNNGSMCKHLSDYRAERTASGKVTYNAKPGSNDDCVIGLALAYGAFTDQNQKIIIL